MPAQSGESPEYKSFEPPVLGILCLIGPVYTISILPQYVTYITKHPLDLNYIPELFYAFFAGPTVTWFILTRYAPLINNIIPHPIMGLLRFDVVEQNIPVFLHGKGIHITLPVPPILIEMYLTDNVWNATVLGITTAVLLTLIVPGIIMQTINYTTVYMTGVLIVIAVCAYLFKTTPNRT